LSVADRNHTAVKSALDSTRSAFIGVALLSAVSNVLMLVSPLFMMQIYDRVLTSRSIPTLLALSLLALGIYGALGVIELIRSKIMPQIGRKLDEQLSNPVFETVLRLPLHAVDGNTASMPLRDLDQIRQFMSGPGPIAIFDLPWMPLYIGILYLFHPLFGLAAVAGALVLLGLTISSEFFLRGPSKRLVQLSTQRWELAEAGRRNADTLHAMGMRAAYIERFDHIHQKYSAENLKTSGVTSTFSTVSKVFRQALQSGMLALGAGLVIDQLASPGAIIAASILTAKALQPIEMVIAQWRGFINLRHSKRRLQETLEILQAEPVDMELPAPHRSFSIAGLAVVAPGSDRTIVRDVSLSLFAGQGLGIIGPSGSGKSSLARALTGVWPAARGSIRLDGAALSQWNSEALGTSIGYLPQNVELFDGTIAENIGRFSASATSESILEAAKLAGVHDLVLSMPQGYDTRVGISGVMLSGGQRQRIGLARAMFGNPFLMVLDEPNANLDAEGEAALAAAVLAARKRGAIVVLIAHRPNILQVVDHLLVVQDGKMRAFGPRDEVLRKTLVHPVGGERKSA
jgi:PrtD family type I secretion system ABC transporter